MTTNREWLDRLAHEDPHALAEWMDAERAMDDVATEEQLRGTANRPNSQSDAPKPAENAENDAAKSDMRDFDDSREKLEADMLKHCAHTTSTLMWPDEANIKTKWVSVPLGTVLEWLDRQEAITREEANHVAGIAAHEAGKILRGQIDELEAENDELREKLSQAIGHAVDIIALQDLSAVDKEGEVTA